MKNKENSYWTVVFWKNDSRISVSRRSSTDSSVSRDEKQTGMVGGQTVAIGSNNTHCPAYHFHDFPSVDFQPRKTSFGATDEYRSSIFTTAPRYQHLLVSLW